MNIEKITKTLFENLESFKYYKYDYIAVENTKKTLDFLMELGFNESTLSGGLVIRLDGLLCHFGPDYKMRTKIYSIQEIKEALNMTDKTIKIKSNNITEFQFLQKMLDFYGYENNHYEAPTWASSIKVNKKNKTISVCDNYNNCIPASKVCMEDLKPIKVNNEVAGVLLSVDKEGFVALKTKDGCDGLVVTKEFMDMLNQAASKYETEINIGCMSFVSSDIKNMWETIQELENE